MKKTAAVSVCITLLTGLLLAVPVFSRADPSRDIAAFRLGRLAERVCELGYSSAPAASLDYDTILKKFDEKEYGVVLAADSTPPLGSEEYVPARNEALEDEMCLKAMDIWRYTGFNMASATSVSCEWNGNYYVVTLSGGDDGMNKESYFSEEGQFYFIEAHPNEWFDGVGDLNETYDFEKGLDEKTDKAVQAFFMEFLDKIHYERKNEVKDLQVQWIYEKDGFTYVMYEDKAEEHDGSGVCFLVRISPEMEMRIEDYHPISNG